LPHDFGPDFPRLTGRNYWITSEATVRYNCIAWAAGDTSRWWQPGRYWPSAANPDDFDIRALELAFASIGFEPSADGRLEPGYEKIALFADSTFYTHAARQLPDGRWTSKLGRSEDIEHETPDDVAGGIYGDVFLFMRRPVVLR